MQAELGANAMLAVSIAACKAGAAEKEVLVICLNHRNRGQNVLMPPHIILIVGSLDACSCAGSTIQTHSRSCWQKHYYYSCPCHYSHQWWKACWKWSPHSGIPPNL